MNSFLPAHNDPHLYTKVIWWSLFLVTLALGLAQVFIPNGHFFGFWTDRDMVRTLQLGQEFQAMGAELSYGLDTRVPGGFLHYVWAVPTFFSDSANISYIYQAFLAAIGSVFIYFAAARPFGHLAGIIAALIYLSSPVYAGTVWRLWNPGFIPLFLAGSVFFYTRVIGEDRPQDLKWVFLFFGIAAQMHFSVPLILLPMLIVCVLTPSTWSWRRWLEALAALIAVYLPYIIYEGLHRFENTLGLVNSQGSSSFRSWGETLPLNLNNFGVFFESFISRWPVHDSQPTALNGGWSLALIIPAFLFLLACAFATLMLVRWLEWGKPVTRFLHLTFTAGQQRIILFCLLTIFLCLAHMIYTPHIELYRVGAHRYTFYILPSVAILVGIAATSFITFWQHRQSASTRVSGTLVSLSLVLASAVSMAVITINTLLIRMPQGLEAHELGYEFVLDTMKEYDWSFEKTVGSTSLWTDQKSDGTWWYRVTASIGYAHYLYEHDVIGSARSPCALYIANGYGIYGDQGIDEDSIRRGFAQPVGSLRILDQRRAGDTSNLLVLYERDEGRCFMTASQRYLLSKEEKIIHINRYDIKIGESVAQDEGDRVRTIANLDDKIYISVLIDKTLEDGAVNVSLHSNQLRGESYNGGFMVNAMIDKPRLKWTKQDTGDRIETPLAYGLVGNHGVLAPLTGTFTSVSTGTYEVTFEADIINGVLQGAWPIKLDDRAPVSIAFEPVTIQ